ncbi:MAG: patatin-like phospholipase family protein [Candidatus Solibacter usitatus]|nr:patatin-like phospholipase family protein [Candidatus Solibacter usitatus]
MRLPLDGGVVLALGGGGMRGVAHLGVLAELEEGGVRIKGIAGTSSGAMLGALWLLAGSAGAVARVRQFTSSGVAKRMPDIGGEVSSAGLAGLFQRARHGVALLRMLTAGHAMSVERFLDQVGFFLPDLTIEAMPRPYLVVATDNGTGDEVRLDRGPLRLAVAASSAMPGLVAPIAWNGRRLQDGGAVGEIPVAAARTLGTPVVAVEVSEGLPRANPDHDGLPRAMFRAAAMGWQELRRRMLSEADAVIAPHVNHLHWADYHAVDESVAAGRAAAREFLEGQLRAGG